MAGSAAPSLAFVSTAPSRTWWPTTGSVGAAWHGRHTPRRNLLRLPLGPSLAGPGGGCGPGPSVPGPRTLSLSLLGGSSQLTALGRKVNGICIECSAVYTLLCLFMARITSRDNKRFVSHGFCHCARPSFRFSGTRRFVICFVGSRVTV